MSRVGSTRDLVAAGGWRAVRGVSFLAGADGTARLFLELEADTDRPEVRPREAWAALLQALPPGWGIRALVVLWPDPAPRTAFLRRLAGWREVGGLREGLRAFLEGEPPPLRRRVVVEVAIPPGDLPAARDVLDGLQAILDRHGVRARPLAQPAITALARFLLSPRREGPETPPDAADAESGTPA